jgi:hypothetical protein
MPRPRAAPFQRRQRFRPPTERLGGWPHDSCRGTDRPAPRKRVSPRQLCDSMFFPPKGTALAVAGGPALKRQWSPKLHMVRSLRRPCLSSRPYSPGGAARLCLPQPPSPKPEREERPRPGHAGGGTQRFVVVCCPIPNRSDPFAGANCSRPAPRAAADWGRLALSKCRRVCRPCRRGFQCAGGGFSAPPHPGLTALQATWPWHVAANHRWIGPGLPYAQVVRSPPGIAAGRRPKPIRSLGLGMSSGFGARGAVSVRALPVGLQRIEMDSPHPDAVLPEVGVSAQQISH